MEGRATITHAASDRFLPLSLSLRCRLCFLASPAGRRGHVVSKGRHHTRAGPTGPSQARSPTACLVCPSGERALRAGVGLSQQREGSRALSWPAGGDNGGARVGHMPKRKQAGLRLGHGAFGTARGSSEPALMHVGSVRICERTADWVLIARQGLFRSAHSRRCERGPENTGSQAAAEGRVEMTRIANCIAFPGSPKANPATSPVSKACIILISPAEIGACFLSILCPIKMEGIWPPACIKLPLMPWAVIIKPPPSSLLSPRFVSRNRN